MTPDSGPRPVRPNWGSAPRSCRSTALLVRPRPCSSETTDTTRSREALPRPESVPTASAPPSLVTPSPRNPPRGSQPSNRPAPTTPIETQRPHPTLLAGCFSLTRHLPRGELAPLARPSSSPRNPGSDKPGFPLPELETRSP
jgi:hypothetical protein